MDLNEYIEKMKVDREKLHFESLEKFFYFDNARRDFFAKIATLSATIGAFSFVILKDVAGPGWLLFGDTVILFVIILCVYFYIDSLKMSQKDFHTTYYFLFERINNTILILRDTVSNDDRQRFFKKELEKILPYIRPKCDNYFRQSMVVILFALAICLIAISFFVRDLV